MNLQFMDANSLAASDQAFSFIGTDAFHHVAGELRYEESGSFTFVYGDTDGDGNADIVIRLAGSHVLSSGDFVL